MLFLFAPAGLALFTIFAISLTDLSWKDLSSKE